MTGFTPLYDIAQVRSITRNFKTTGDWQIAEKVLLLFAFLWTLNSVADLFIFGRAFCQEFSWVQDSINNELCLAALAFMRENANFDNIVG